ncbi:hypothetical protein MKX01_031942 [Papaver californicum]|nr:hypothetical protein MKX01_031942 [Papaver californicum]
MSNPNFYLDPSCQKLPWLNVVSDVIDLDRRANKCQVYPGDDPMADDQRRQQMNIDSSCIELIKNMDENINSSCIEVPGKDFSKLPSKRTRRRVFAPVSVPAARIPDLVNENRVDENVDLNCVEVSSKDFSKIPSKRTRRRVIAPVSVPSLSTAARFSAQNSGGYRSPEIHGKRYTSVGENIGDCNGHVKDGLGLRVDDDIIMYEHKGNGLQHPTSVTGELPINSCDTSLKCPVAHGGFDNSVRTNVRDEKVHMESQSGKRGSDGVLFSDGNVKWIISPSSTNKDFASAPTASVNDSAHHPEVEEKQTKCDGTIILYDKNVNMIISPSLLKKDFADIPTTSVNDFIHHPGIKRKQIISPTLLKKDFASTPTASVNDAAHHPAIEEKHTENDERVVFQAALEDLSQPKAEANLPDGLLTTVSMIALIQYQRYNQSQSTTGDNGDHEMGEMVQIGESNDQHMFPRANCADHFFKERPEAGTLIVCPTSILCQWAQELDHKVADGAKLSVLVSHESNRAKDPVKLAKYDVVLTTYAVVANAFPRQGNEIDDDVNNNEIDGKKKIDCFSIGCPSDPLAKMDKDEGQCIKNYRTCRWCFSGTPLQNKIDDLYSYFRFLKYYPYSVYQKFSSLLKSTSRTGDYKKLQVVLKTILLRRTKDTLINSKPIITLPPKSISLMNVELSTEEQSFYSQLETRSSLQFMEYDRAGTINQNYANILVLLLYLRMACDHPLLTSLEMARKLPRDMLCKLFTLLEDSLAYVVNDTHEDAVVTTCGYVFCRQCVAEHLIHLSSDLVYSKATLSRFFSSDLVYSKATSSSEVIEKSAVHQRSYRSSKIKAALEILYSSLSSGDCSVDTRSDSLVETPVKTIVFSQWTCILDLMEISLDQSGIKFKRFDGTMTLALRDKAVKDFISNPEVSVILMSLKAGNLGLNLVAACHVILLDPWWNPTTEDQAIDRAHRLGQTHPVTVSRLAVSSTVEDRIFKLQEQKRKLVASVFGDDKFGGSSARLKVDDLRFLFSFRV